MFLLRLSITSISFIEMRTNEVGTLKTPMVRTGSSLPSGLETHVSRVASGPAKNESV